VVNILNISVISVHQWQKIRLWLRQAAPFAMKKVLVAANELLP